MKHTMIDLFSGAGGLTTGFYLAGFKPLCAIDIDAKSLTTYKHNYPTAHILHQDISNVDPLELRLFLELKREELTVLIGGPPCQGFSRNIPANRRCLNDPRNHLYQVFLDFVKEFRPRFVVIENVPEILKAYAGSIKYEIMKQLELEGYKVKCTSLNSASYGIPQTRARAFFLAGFNQSIKIPEPTHSGDIRSDYRNPITYTQPKIPFVVTNTSTIITVRDAIGDLPALEAGEEYKGEDYPFPPNTLYQAMIRNNSNQLTNHIARPLSDIQMARAKALAEGEDARNLPIQLAPKKHYSGAYGRLYWNKPARTMTKWLFHPGSGRFFHPTQNRTITIREAARLHSYPDSFMFLGTYTNMAAQIGESVPPLLGKVIAESILQELDH